MSLILIFCVYVIHTYILRICDIYVTYTSFIKDRHTHRQIIAYVYDLVACPLAYKKISHILCNLIQP